MEEVIKISSNNVFEILRKNGFEIKEKRSIFKRTEQLLYLLPDLKKAINHNNRKIKDLEKYGISKKQSAIHIIPDNVPPKEDENDIIKREISKLKQRNYIIDTQLKWANDIIQTLNTDKFYELINLKYRDGKTREEIAEYFNCDVKTVTRNKDRIINYLGKLFFANDSLNELGC